jgi:hypothetical protein
MHNYIMLITSVSLIIHCLNNIEFCPFQLVLHFWSDEDCINILAQCKKAIPSRETGGKVIVIDIVLGSSLETITDTELLMDMLMFICTRRQRNEKEWSTIFMKAGFSDYKIVRKLGHRGVIEVYPYVSCK